MDILAKCPQCDAGLPIHSSNAPERVACGACQREIPLSMSSAIRADAAVDVCPVCSGADFYIRKDFNPKIGLTIIIIGAVISGVFYFYKRDFIAYSILGFATLVDLLIYGRLKFVTVCYRCHSEFRGAYKPTAPAFDLHTADVLEMEYERRIGRR
jgi:hypothetical protein